MKCENCEYMLAENALFCPKCGCKVNRTVKQEESIETIFCVHCGEKLEADAQFCNYCGKSTKEKDENAVKLETDSIKKATSNTKKFAGGIILIVTAVSLAIFVKGILFNNNLFYGKNIELPSGQNNKKENCFLNELPYSSHLSLFDNEWTYELEGYIYKSENGYGISNNLPEELDIIEGLKADFGHTGKKTTISVTADKDKNSDNEAIYLNFQRKGYGTSIGTGIGSLYADNETFCYIKSTEDTDYLVIESIKYDQNSKIENNVYHFGLEGENYTITEKIEIWDLRDFSKAAYTYEFNNKYQGYTYYEEVMGKSVDEKISRYLFCQDGVNYHYDQGFESIYLSEESALNYISNELAKYKLDGRLSYNNSSVGQVTPIFVSKDIGTSQDVNLDNCDNVTLYGILYISK